MSRLFNHILFAAGLCCAPGTHSALAQKPPARRPGPSATDMDLPAYRLELERWSKAVSRIEAHVHSLSLLREALPKEWVVNVTGERFEIPTEWLDQELRVMVQDPAQVKTRAAEIQKRLAAMLDEANRLDASTAAPPVSRARADLDHVLSRREFRSMRGPNSFDLMMERLRYWIARMLSKIFGALPRGGIGNILAWVLVAIGLAALVVLGAANLARVTGRRPVPLPIGTISISEETRNWIQDAGAAAARGDYRDAIHCAYWAAIAQLENLGLLPRDRSRTPRESVRLMEKEHGYSGALTAVTAVFERVWYGFRPADSSDWTAVTAQLEKIGCRLDST